MLKYSIERCVCAPQSLSAGTSTSPRRRFQCGNRSSLAPQCGGAQRRINSGHGNRAAKCPVRQGVWDASRFAIDCAVNPGGLGWTYPFRAKFPYNSVAQSEGEWRCARWAAAPIDNAMTETVAEILDAYRRGTLKPEDIVARSFARIRRHDDPAIFIALRGEADVVAEAKALARDGNMALPLAGMPRWR